jgi:hypothetical protein
MNQARVEAIPATMAGAKRKGFRAELDELRARMHGLGLGYGEIASEVSRRYRSRPREAHRLARGWTLDQAAARFNERAAREGTDPQALASMTGPRLCAHEKWPHSSRRPSVYVLCVLAAIYETSALDLLDLVDHESLPQQDRLVLLHRVDAGTASVVLSGDPVLLGNHGGHISITPTASAGGMSLTLPYVPGRLVIELSGPAEKVGLSAGSGDDREVATTRLGLVQDTTSRAEGSRAG